jgi:hypothetical protein
VDSAGATRRQPYPGLRPFRRNETDLFFGREDCVDKIVDLLGEQQFLAVLGSSGSGKSSLVRTGLLYALEIGMMARAGSRWRIVEFRPGDQPLRSLARGLARTAANEAEADEVDLLHTFLMRGPRSIIEWCQNGNLGARENLLLLVDQFEELFRFHEYAGQEEAAAFVALLLESCRRDSGLPIFAVLTMRSEYLGACSLLEGLTDRMNGAQFLTPRMTRDQCRAAIEGPAGVCGFEIEPALVNDLLNDLAGFAPWQAHDEAEQLNQLDRLARRADQLPLLQHALNELWRRAMQAALASTPQQTVRLTLDDYKKLGGLQGALDRNAEYVLQSLSVPARRNAEDVFRVLTAGTSVADATRRSTLLQDVVAISGRDETSVREVVNAFRSADCNFLLPEHDVALTDQTRIDIAHESIIRQWKRLGQWVEAEFQDAETFRSLRKLAELNRTLRSSEIDEYEAWWKAAPHTTAWAGRYGGGHAVVESLLLQSMEEREQQRPDVFVSHVASERDIAVPVVERLTKLGLKVAFDEDVSTSADFEAGRLQGPNTARVAMVCWTVKATTSQWIIVEATAAHRTHNAISVYFERCAPPPPFDADQAIWLADWHGQGDHPGWTDLLAWFEHKLQRSDLLSREHARAAADQERAGAALEREQRSARATSREAVERPSAHFLEKLQYRRRHRILSIDAAGARLHFTLQFLSRLEGVLAERSGNPKATLSDYFDLIGGPSLGGVVAAFLAMGYRVSDMIDFLMRFIAIAHRRRFPFGLRGRGQADTLGILLEEVFKDRTLQSGDFLTGFAACIRRLDSGSIWIVTNNPHSPYWDDSAHGYVGNRNLRIATLLRACIGNPGRLDPVELNLLNPALPKQPGAFPALDALAGLFAEDKRKRDPRAGLFVDGMVGGLVDPSLHLLMTAVLRPYGLNWELGADKLMLVSVGSGMSRTKYVETSTWPALSATRVMGLVGAIMNGVVNDTIMRNLMTMQMLGESSHPWHVNAELGDMKGCLITAEPLFLYRRYDVMLDAAWLQSDLGIAVLERDLAAIRQQDIANSDATERAMQIGHLAAEKQVRADDFPALFDTRFESEKALT